MRQLLSKLIFTAIAVTAPALAGSQPESQPAVPEPQSSVFQLNWDDQTTWVKAALLVGSIVLGLRAYREMKG